MSGGETLRYEFRIFGEDLGAQARLLRKLGTRLGTEVTAETYLVGRNAPHANVKLREGELDVKLLRGFAEDLELWEPTFSARLPLDRGILEEKALAPLRVSLESEEAETVSEAVLRRIARQHADLRAVDVVKSRDKYDLGSTWAEFVFLRIEGQPLRSVAVESSTPEAVFATLARLGINDEPNVSYARQMHRIAFGLEEEPHGEPGAEEAPEEIDLEAVDGDAAARDE